MKKTSPKRKNFSNRKILQIVTGSVAAFKIADLVKDLREEGAQVTCVMTPSARHFVTPLILRAVSGNRVYEDFFAVDTPYDVLHTSLAEESDIILVAPASADFLAKLRAGMADDLASCIILATRKPVVIVPAMNDRMYSHPLTQENIAKLRSIGYHFVDPVQGKLVCGTEGVGHIASNAEIMDVISQKLGRAKKS